MHNITGRRECLLHGTLQKFSGATLKDRYGRIRDIQHPQADQQHLADLRPFVFSNIMKAQLVGISQSSISQLLLISRRSMTRSDVGLAQQNRTMPASLSSAHNPISVDLP